MTAPVRQELSDYSIGSRQAKSTATGEEDRLNLFDSHSNREEVGLASTWCPSPDVDTGDVGLGKDDDRATRPQLWIGPVTNLHARDRSQRHDWYRRGRRGPIWQTTS